MGVGKTALAERLGERMNAKLVLERVEENPFLDRFYVDMRSYAFQTQLFFLLSRHKLQEELKQPELFAETIVSDCLFDKDRIFAGLTLTEHELALYDRIYELLSRDAVRPDLVVFLQARPEILLARIKQRARPYEAGIDPTYVDQLADAYNHYFLHYETAPVLIVNTEQLDFVRNQRDFDDLYKAIMATGSGRRFYSPKGMRK